MAKSILVVNPVAPRLNEPQQLRQTCAGLTGKVVGFIDNAKPNFNHLVDDLAKLLISKYGVASVIKRRKRAPAIPASDAVLNELSEHCNLVITGSGD